MSKQPQSNVGTGNVIVGYTSAYDAASNRLYLRALHAPSRSSSHDQHDSADRMREKKRG